MSPKTINQFVVLPSSASQSCIIYCFETSDHLGKGKLGNVYKGYIDQLGERKGQIVVKKISKNDIQQANFQSEFTRLSKISHQNCVKIIDSFEDSANQYIITELCPDNVQNRLRQFQQGLQELNIFNLLSQLVNGIEYLHKHNIVHQSIKPSNMLIKDQMLKLTDYGINKLAKSKQSIRPKARSYYHLSPQILFDLQNGSRKLKNKYHIISGKNFSKKSISKKSDIWSIGVTLIQMFGYKLFGTKCNSLEDFYFSQIKVEDCLAKFLRYLKIKCIKSNQTYEFWKTILVKTLQFFEKDRWSIQQLKQYINRNKALFIHNQGREIVKVQIKYSDQDVKKIIQFRLHIQFSILELKQNISQTRTSKIKIWLLLYLSFNEMKSFFAKNIQRIEDAKTIRVLEQMYKEVMFFKQIDQTELLKETLVNQRGLLQRRCIKQKVKYYLQKQWECEFISDLKQLYNQFKQLLKNCKITRLYTVLFAIVIKLDKNFNPETFKFQRHIKNIQSSYKTSLTGRIAALHDFYIDTQTEKNIQTTKVAFKQYLQLLEFQEKVMQQQLQLSK